MKEITHKQKPRLDDPNVELIQRLTANVEQAKADLALVNPDKIDAAQLNVLTCHLSRAREIVDGIKWVVGDQHRKRPD